ncbi:MAG TPA: MerR family transcriptional regulator [Candidatus Angelobacter sp.]
MTSIRLKAGPKRTVSSKWGTPHPVTIDKIYIYREYYSRMTYSSGQVARKLGIGISTLSKYITREKLPTPRSVTTGGITVYLWTDADIERARKLLPKIKNGRKTRYKKQKKQAKKK